MNHNSYNLSIGDWVLLDDRLPLVKIFGMTDLKIYSTVGNHESPIDTWQVMTSRLKPCSKNEQPITPQSAP